MADLANVYEETRLSIIDLARAHKDDLTRPVPATAEWSARDVLGHVVGDVEGILRGDFPADFFASFGDPDAVVSLNEWTERQLQKFESLSLDELFAQWDDMTPTLLSMMRGETEWPDGVLPGIADRAITIDLGVHRQDLLGAFGIEADRDAPAIKIGSSAYVAILDMRLRSDGVGALAIEVPGKQWTVGGDDPEVTLRTDRFELFRSLSGRRSPAQVRNYDWTGDPEPFLTYFYPYGPREDSLVE
ncbi:MAG: maleylpyruvate isomerase family mycothiol-dependent enzyme [Actinomycetota bacterium]